MRFLPVVAFSVLLFLAAYVPPVYAVSSCGGVSDSCQCGANNPYPCCNNGNGKASNCTWGAWHMACCNWGAAMPSPWQNAMFWAGNYAGHPDYNVVSQPVPNSIGCMTSSGVGHVAWVTAVNGSTVDVKEQSCCEGSSCYPNCSWCINGFRDHSYSKSYFDGGYIVKKGAVNPCGDGNCNNGEDCNSCSADCGTCPYCGDGQCNNGENCDSCSDDCGSCETCGDNQCNGGESCASCPNDCGGCCGNGDCDNGENCDSCPKDCGECTDMPEGELQVVNCAVIAGWALDPDIGGTVAVRIMSDGQQVAEVTADQPNDSSPGHGFSYKPDAGIKDGQVHTIEAMAVDDKGEKVKTLPGSGKKLLCRNGVEQYGIFAVEHLDSAGIDVFPVAEEGAPFCSLRLAHSGGLEYPNSGTVTARALLANTPFEQLTFDSCGGFADPLYQAAISIDGGAVVTLGSQLVECTPVTVEQPGQELTVSLAATSMTSDPEARELVLKNLAAWSKGWKVGYSDDSSGLVWSNETTDTLGFHARPDVAECIGHISASRQFAKPFDAVEFTLSGESVPAVEVTISNQEGTIVGIDDCTPGAPCSPSDFAGQGLEVKTDCGGTAALPAGWQLKLENLKVFSNFVQAADPWSLIGEKAWGLTAAVPEPSAPGLALRLSTEPDVSMPSGTVRGEMAFPLPPADRIIGMLSYALPGSCFNARVSLDGTAAEDHHTGTYFGPFDIELNGGQLAVSMAASGDCEGQPGAGHVEIQATSYRRGGWWTTPSPAFAGIRDLRGEGCSVKFENLKWWGMSGNQAHGSLHVHRYLDKPHNGVRYNLNHSFFSAFFTLELMLDGQPVSETPLLEPGETAQELTDVEFTDIGFRLSVQVPEVYAYKWEVEAFDVEVLDPAAGWVSVCLAAEGEPELEGVFEVVETGADIITVGNDAAIMLVDGQTPPGKKSSGCGMSHSSGGPGPLMTLFLLVAAILGASGTRFVLAKMRRNC